jgi:hypothetical protein
VIKRTLFLFSKRWKRESAPFPSFLVHLFFPALSITVAAEELPAGEPHGDVVTVGCEAEDKGGVREHLPEHTEGFGFGVGTIMVGHRRPPAEGKKWAVGGG